MLPRTITLVRHGLSEGNAMLKLLRKGLADQVPPELMKKRSDHWRLTDEGIKQAKAAGVWLAENIKGPIGRCVTSNYVRALETASYILPSETIWYVSPYLRERSWGDAEGLSAVDRMKVDAELKRAQDRDPFHARPPGGESIADICFSRADRSSNTLERECSDMDNVLFNLHGESMWAFWIRYTQMRIERFEELHHSKHPFDHIYNCQIIQFSRVNPETGEVRPKLGWMRSVCPWDMKRSRNEWEVIVRHRPTGAELRAEVEAIPRYIN